MHRAAGYTLSIGVLLLAGMVARASDDQPAAEERAAQTGAVDAATQGSEGPSAAERILRLEQSIAETETELAELKAGQDDPQDEYALAKSEFTELDAKVKEREGVLTEHGDAAEADSARAELDGLRKSWDLAKERVDLALRERTTVQEKIKTLALKLEQDRAAIQRLETPPTSASQPAAAQPGSIDEPGGAQPSTNGAAQPASAPSSVEAPAGQGAAATDPPPGAADAAGAGSVEPPSEELVVAQKDAEAKQAQAHQAEADVRSVADRLETLRITIEDERVLLDTARKRAVNAQNTQSTLSEQARSRSAEGAPRQEVAELWSDAESARVRAQEAQAEVTRHVVRVDQLQAELQGLQAEQIGALREAEAKRADADEAQAEVESLENPFSWKNLTRRLMLHGPSVAGIAIGLIVVLWLVRVLERRIVFFIASWSGDDTAAEREDRIKTLAAVFRNTATIVAIIGGVFMFLAEIEIDITPLLGGAAVMGLAVAFGAQSLIKDYFYGFMILLEDQYGVNDVVRIGGVAGLVERVTLRVTVLRDLEGTLHFVPHGHTTTVSNMTHGWSRAVLDIGVGYGEDTDRVVEVLTELGAGLRNDPEFGKMILDDPEVLGVDGLNDSAVTIKLLIKTQPLKQWAIKREMLRRIKRRFDELGIEIPFPHRTIYHHHAGEAKPGMGVPPDAEPRA
ncbi:MAG: mechanosensitive ion channel [bacterium]|nr:mechanosensitive ion channel [bacterium]